MKEGEGMERANEREGGGKKEKTDRERTDTLLSLGVNKRDLSSQSFAVCTEAMGDPGCVCVFVTVRRTCAHSHTLSIALYSVRVCLCVYLSVCGSVGAFVH